MIPILLVPGMLCTAEVFTPQIRALWPHGPITVASTLEGETIAEMATVILSKAPPVFVLIGSSMGGYISLEIIRQAPERVLKLVLCSVSATMDSAEQIAQRRALLERARSGDFEHFLEQAFSVLLHPIHRQDPLLREIFVRMGGTVGLDGMARQNEAIIRRAEALPWPVNISVPTLVLVGDSDTLTPIDRAKELVQSIPNATLEIIPQCGHGVTLEQPEYVNRVLLEWLVQ